MTTTSTNPTIEQPTFHQDASKAVRAVRVAFSELLASVGADPSEPQAMARLLGVNKNLAWKLSKIVLSNDPAIVFQQMPGSGGIRILLDSLQKSGASPAQLDAAASAIEDYERLIQVHSGDRATLEMLGSTLSPQGHVQLDEQHRKLFYQGASYVWGVQAKTLLKVGLVGPGRAHGLLDFASLNAQIDFRRLRPGVTWVMTSRHVNNDDGSDMQTPRFEAIDERYDDDHSPPLMEDFCSKPLPTLRRHTEGAWTSFELTEGPIGNTGSLTFVAGTIHRDLPFFRSPENTWGEHSARCDTPAEQIIVDIFVHQDLDFAMTPEVRLYSLLGESLPNYRRERSELPLDEPLLRLGASPLPLATPEVRHYNQMVDAMFDRTGWDPRDFAGFRLKMAYPACPTMLKFRYQLPDLREDDS